MHLGKAQRAGGIGRLLTLCREDLIFSARALHGPSGPRLGPWPRPPPAPAALEDFELVNETFRYVSEGIDG